ncbi:MAG: DUF4252 domain-containing protein [Saprospiraceae bacterium]|nr:DUF4252 domain-containing protein [Saprospiraceae bacterium]
MKFKNLALILILALMGVNINAQSALDQFFSQHQDDTAFTVVNISPKMFQMLAHIDTDDPESEEVMDLVRGITGLRILAKDHGDGTKLYNDAFSKISKNGFEELLTVRDGGENVRFMVREGNSPDIIHQLVLLVGGADDFVLMDLTGVINLKTIGKLSKSIDVPGAKHLEKLEEH